jgi:triacylglycerol lipase
MLDEHARAIAALGTELHPGLFKASEQLYAPFHAPGMPPDVAVTRDTVYGSGERNRLDVFTTSAAASRPVLLFVHGGGFVMGDKSSPGSPYYDNVGVWAARRGYIGVTIAYGLAPASRYPSGAVDLAAAIRWVRANIAAYGGDPRAIVVMGQSAGAIHAATYAARQDLWTDPSGGIVGMILLSGVYDFPSEDQPPNVLAYFGDPATAAAASPLTGLVASNIPLFVVVAQFDPPLFHAQAMLLARALYARDECLPQMLALCGHNHLTEITHLNAAGIDDDILALHIAEFVRSTTRTEAGTPLTV